MVTLEDIDLWSYLKLQMCKDFRQQHMRFDSSVLEWLITFQEING